MFYVFNFFSSYVTHYLSFVSLEEEAGVAGVGGERLVALEAVVGHILRNSIKVLEVMRVQDQLQSPEHRIDLMLV